MTFHFQFAVRGARVSAIYLDSEIPSYKGNPLIEALPPVFNNEEAADYLSFYPKIVKDALNAPDEMRYHLLQNSLKFFSALDVHLDLERRISCVIRVGYADRNPLKVSSWNHIDKAVRQLRGRLRTQYGVLDQEYKSTGAVGFNIVGISGIGKTQTVERILKLYPQVIIHSHYNGQNFTHIQLAWLKLDCPFDGSTRGLCYSFFISVDNLLGTEYYEQYAKRARSVDEMLPHMARIAANHFIGVLVIDEIQRLNKASSGGAEKMLDFFVQLVNTIGVPIILIGTFKALAVLSTTISQMRRGSGQGDLIWDRMQFDEQWQLFMEDLWNYQYVKEPILEKNRPLINEALYEESQGITDLAIKLFMFAQELAISSKVETLSSSIIRSAALQKFNLLQPALKALKTKNVAALNAFEDAYPHYLRQLTSDDLRRMDLEGVIKDQPETRVVIAPVEKKKTVVSGSSESKDGLVDSKAAIKEFFKKKIENKREPKENVLLQILLSIPDPTTANVFASFEEKSYVRPASEFLHIPIFKEGAR